MNARNFRHFASVLLIGTAAIFLLIFVHGLWHERISRNRQEAALQPLLEAFPHALRTQVRLQQAGELDDEDALGLRVATHFYRAYFQNQNGDHQFIGWVIPAVARDGYGGDIALAIALNQQAEVIGVQVLNHRETAGMGDRMERRHSDWLDTFNRHSLHTPTRGSWYVSKDGGAFDQMTGATITSRAVTNTVKHTLEYYSAHRDEWATPTTDENSEAAHE